MALSESEFRQIQQTARHVQKALDQNSNAVLQINKVIRDNADRILQTVDIYNQAIAAVSSSLAQLGNLATLSGRFSQALVDLIRALPGNWPADIDVASAMDIAQDGIPIVGVPREGILVKLLAASTYEQRSGVLQDHIEELEEDIHEALVSVKHPDLIGPVQLAHKAFDAWKDGHIETAQTLAVIIVESVVTRHFANNRSYAKVRREVERNLASDEWAVPELAFLVAMAPIMPLYQEFYPERGDVPPSRLSRHATVHHPDPEQFSEDRALIAMLLQASILPAFQDVLELIDGDAEHSP